jgi:hypothetical protein
MSVQTKNKIGFGIRAEVFNIHMGMSDNLGYRGFRIGFANGYAISVQFGTVNYCTANNPIGGIPHNVNAKEWMESVCPDAEIAIIAPDGEFVPFKDGNAVRGHTPPDSLAEIIAWVVKQPNNPQ